MREPGTSPEMGQGGRERKKQRTRSHGNEERVPGGASVAEKPAERLEEDE